MRPSLRGAVAVLVGLVAACSDPQPPPQNEVAFPADYADSYVEVRDCRKSADHELEFVRILADSSARAPYQQRAGGFPDGAVVLKEQYDVADDTCAGPVLQWTVMVKNSAASGRLGWDWQRVDAERRVVSNDLASCSGCHQACTGSGLGYDATCADP
jgi:hypothetical protein